MKRFVQRFIVICMVLAVFSGGAVLAGVCSDAEKARIRAAGFSEKRIAELCQELPPELETCAARGGMVFTPLGRRTICLSPAFDMNDMYTGGGMFGQPQTGYTECKGWHRSEVQRCIDWAKQQRAYDTRQKEVEKERSDRAGNDECDRRHGCWENGQCVTGARCTGGHY
ncbi:MAG TPA: hypothetical protein VI895_02760 [Bdellovibrionota bacterium]|nr:hypothetical protein [Bdellovibrionota bacterium]